MTRSPEGRLPRLGVAGVGGSETVARRVPSGAGAPVEEVAPAAGEDPSSDALTAPVPLPPIPLRRVRVERGCAGGGGRRTRVGEDPPPDLREGSS